LKKFENEFLISLAPIWMACKWRLMGHRLHNWPVAPPDLQYDLLGMLDYAAEMRLLCAEVQAREK